jgi:hypothetical protein
LHIETACANTLKRLLADPEHPLANKLLKRSRHIRAAFAFKTSKRQTEEYKNSFAQTTRYFN